MREGPREHDVLWALGEVARVARVPLRWKGPRAYRSWPRLVPWVVDVLLSHPALKGRDWADGLPAVPSPHAPFALIGLQSGAG